MNHRLSTNRSARSRGRTLLSIDKNYARRIDTLYRKAFEAPGAIADETTRKRCRLAVMQELDGVCTVFLTHNDSSWPPTREQLKDFQALYPQDYISVNQANGTLSGREPEGDISGDDDAISLKQQNSLGQDAELHVFDLVSEETRDENPPTGGRRLPRHDKNQLGNLSESVNSPLKECGNPLFGLHDNGSNRPYVFNDSQSNDTPKTNSGAPQRRLFEHRRNAVRDKSPSSAVKPLSERDVTRGDPENGVCIDPSLLSTPQNKDIRKTVTTGPSSDRVYRSRLSARQECSISPSPRRRRAGVWRTYKTDCSSM